MSVSETIPQGAGSSNGLILDSLEVKNFRAFRHLTIEKLGRVNLITGKNNVGKTSLLEALCFYAGRGSSAVVQHILKLRDELFQNAHPFEIINSLTNIGPKSDERILPFVVGSVFDSDNRMTLFIEERTDFSSPVRVESDPVPLIPVPAQQEAVFFKNYYVRITFGNKTSPYFPIETYLDANISARYEQSKFRYEYLDAAGLNSHAAGLLWDNIALTEAEEDVLSALRLIDKRVQRISLIGQPNGSAGRVPVVKIPSLPNPRTLRSLGDGMSRLFGITLALVNASSGVVLIDEVETGLHYSVLIDVWRLIFQTARRLNVQVFATTHSWDCIEAFQQAAAEDDDPNSGVLVRLQNEDGDVTATVFDERRLAIVTRQGIEVR